MEIGLDPAEWRPKDLRDTFASWLLTAGIRDTWVQKQLGHGGLDVTLRHYATWADEGGYVRPLELADDEVASDLLARLVVTTPTTIHQTAANS